MIYYQRSGRSVRNAKARWGGHKFNRRSKDRSERMAVMVKVEELLEALKKRDEDKNKNTVLWVLAIIVAVTAVAGIAYAVYRYFAPDYL